MTATSSEPFRYRAASTEELHVLGDLLGYPVGPDMRGILVEDAAGDLAAAVAFDDWTHSSVNAHIWIKNARVLLKGRLIREVCHYAFVQAGRVYLQAITPADNTASLKFQQAFGMKEIARIPDGWDKGVDMIVTRMSRNECHWLAGDA